MDGEFDYVFDRQRISPYDLHGKQKEVFNFQKISAVLADYGFECQWLMSDYNGADFLAHHLLKSTVLKVQMKSTLTISKRYIDKGLWIAWPSPTTNEMMRKKQTFSRQDWFLAKHDELIAVIEEVMPRTLETVSWRKEGNYHFPAPSKKLMARLAEYQLTST